MAPFRARPSACWEPTASEQQTVTGPDGRFTLTGAPGGSLTMVVRAGGFAEWPQSVAPSSEVNVVLKIATLFETVTVTPTRSAKAAWRRAGQRQHRREGNDSSVAGRGRRRCAAAGADLQPVPAKQQSVVASDRAGRVAARDRSERREPHPRARGRRAVQRSVRRLGLLDACAAGERRSHRGHRRIELEPVRQLRHGRRHQHHPDSRGPANGRVQDAVRQPQQPEGGLLRQRRVGQVGRGGRGRRVRHRRVPDRGG